MAIMSSQSAYIEKLLKSVGVTSQWLRRIRFGGVVGKQAIVGAVIAAALALIGRHTDNTNVQLLCVGGLIFDCFVTIGAISFHGHKHPLEATLEGGEVVAWGQMQQEYAQKGVRELPASQPVLEGVGPRPLNAATADRAESRQPNNADGGNPS
ncbi:MAG: hypothetical protein ACLQMT_08465 [Candidatus Acidiferrales bacterium]